MKLINEVALVTGAAQGLGASHARVLVEEGASVVITDVQDELGEALAAELGQRAIYVHLDASLEEDWANAIERAEAAFGTVSVLVNNAGIATGEQLHKYDFQDWQRIIGINLSSVFLGMRAVSKGMRAAKKGSIINTSSIMGLSGNAFTYGYTASKWGIRGLSKSASVELAPHGIRVNTIFPGLIVTAMNSTEVHDQARGLSYVPLDRPGRPEEASRVVAFLASSESSFVTGAEIVIDGGQTSNLPSSLPGTRDLPPEAE